MARNTGPKCRLCRRESTKLFLKGERCFTAKCALEKRPTVPGDHGKARARRKISWYGIQLREKQKLRRIYGIGERQFKNYFLKAEKQKGITGENFLKILESRLDNVVYRLGFTSSREQARHLVSHGHFAVNGRKVDVPSCLTKPGDVINLREKSKQNPFIIESLKKNQGRTPYSWLLLDAESFKGEVKGLPAKEDINLPVKEELIVEFYSK